MFSLLAGFGASLVTTLALDGLWLGVIASRFYSEQMGALARRSGTSLDPLWLPAILVWCIIPIGVVLFAIPRAAGDPLRALLWGGLFGAILYAVYDLTNLSVITGWSVRMTLVDIAWGTVLCAVATVAGTLATTAAK